MMCECDTDRISLLEKMKVELFLNKIIQFVHPRNSLVYYIKSLMAFEQGKIEKSQELLNRASFNGAGEYEVRLLDFEDVLGKVEVVEENSLESEDAEPHVEAITIQKTSQPELDKSGRECHICQKMFKKTFSLKRHLLSHSGVKNYGELSTGISRE